MAEMKKLVIEGDVTLAYFADQMDGKRVLIDTEITDDGPAVCSDCSGRGNQESLGSRISNEIGFPNDAEFDELYRKMEELREKGLRTEEGVPDVTRQAKMRITIEVL
jgi:hypothetical protein